MSDFSFKIELFERVELGQITREKPYIPPKPRRQSSLAFVLDGTLLYTVCGQTFRAEPNSVLVVTPGEVDVSASEGDCVRYIYIDFYGELPELAHEALDRVNYPPNPDEIYALFRESLELQRERGFGWRGYCTANLCRIITRLAECGFRGSEGYYRYDKIRPAIVKLETDFASPISISDLTELCRMSASNLTRLFAEFTGMPPIEYLTHVRIENAKRQLAKGGRTISEVAVQCGFSSIYSFSRAFRRQTGISPREWN